MMFECRLTLLRLSLLMLITRVITRLILRAGILVLESPPKRGRERWGPVTLLQSASTWVRAREILPESDGVEQSCTYDLNDTVLHC
jgi:hypothetical protein